MPDTAAVEVHGLTKTFGTVTRPGRPGPDRARRVRWSASSGPNGAGKSTTIRILLGLLRAGRRRSVRLLGGDPWATPSRCTGGWPTSPAT